MNNQELAELDYVLEFVNLDTYNGVKDYYDSLFGSEINEDTLVELFLSSVLMQSAIKKLPSKVETEVIKKIKEVINESNTRN